MTGKQRMLIEVALAQAEALYERSGYTVAKEIADRLREAVALEIEIPQTTVRVKPAPGLQPVPSSSVCRECGGSMVRTGACETCTQCGSTTGCG